MSDLKHSLGIIFKIKKAFSQNSKQILGSNWIHVLHENSKTDLSENNSVCLLIT